MQVIMDGFEQSVNNTAAGTVRKENVYLQTATENILFSFNETNFEYPSECKRHIFI